MDVPPGEIKDCKIYVKNRIMELNITLREYQEITGIRSPRITPASSVQNISQHPVAPFAQPPPLVPFTAISPRMSVGNISSHTQYPPPGFQVRGPTDMAQRNMRERGVFNPSLHSTMQHQGRGRSASIRGLHS